MDQDNYVWGYIDGGPVTTKTYKVFWDIAIRHSTDGYFYKTVPIQKGHKYTTDYEQAKEILEKVNNAIILLGMGDISKTGIVEEQ